MVRPDRRAHGVRGIPAGLVVLATLAAWWLRTRELALVPPAMTSDHIEMLLDAMRVHEGVRTVFFGNNGGREAAHMFLVAILGGPLGLGFSFHTLKWATILEGVLTVPAVAWMAAEVCRDAGARDCRLGAWVGVAAAWLVAISSWHVMLSRLGLRVALLPLATALAIGLAARAWRTRRTSDAAWLGLVLGAGLYGYQANRLLPVAVLLPLVVARRWRAVTIAAAMAVVLAVPMVRYAVANPEAFWSRTTGRLYGDDLAARPSMSAMGGVFVRNYATALGMYHVRGDVAWINNAGQRPALDPVTGAALLAGLAAWALRLRRRNDAAWWLPPSSIVVMLLPTAMALAYPIENPSFTRASGTLPGIYFLAGFPIGWALAQLERGGWRLRRSAAGAALVVVALVIAGAGAYRSNREAYFTAYRVSYERSWRPYGEIARPIREFVDHGGALGNAFVVAYPHWLDHRILGEAAGDPRWPNGLASRVDLLTAVAANAGTRYAFDASRSTLVLFHPADTDTESFLRGHFASGEVRDVDYRWPDGTEDSVGRVRVFTAPPGTLVTGP